MTVIIAGIGSRKTPQGILNEMQKVGAWCRESKIFVRSGHAGGADLAFEAGSQEFCIAYLPWRRFNREFKSKARTFVPEDFSLEVQEQLDSYTNNFHPAPQKLTNGGRALMNRNVLQVLGGKLNMPVNAVICWTEDGLASGGTGQTLRIAKHHNIQVLNMYALEWNTADKVTAALALFL